jgi:hypothetical protein
MLLTSRTVVRLAFLMVLVGAFFAPAVLDSAYAVDCAYRPRNCSVTCSWWQGYEWYQVTPTHGADFCDGMQYTLIDIGGKCAHQYDYTGIITGCNLWVGAYGTSQTSSNCTPTGP